MVKGLFDADALIAQFETATTKQGEQLRQAVSTATLQALQGRELTLKNIRATLKSVTGAAGAGAARNAVAGVDVEGLLDKAVAGMDDALLKAVEANRVALGQLVAQGADLREKHLKKALDEMDKFEDSLMAAVRKASEGAQTQFGGQIGAGWGHLLEKMQAGGTLSGARAEQATEKLLEDMQGAMRNSRAAGMRAAQALAESYTAMVSGVLIGMSDALHHSAGKNSVRKK